MIVIQIGHQDLVAYTMMVPDIHKVPWQEGTLASGSRETQKKQGALRSERC